MMPINLLDCVMCSSVLICMAAMHTDREEKKEEIAGCLQVGKDVRYFRWAQLPSSCHAKSKQYCGPTVLRLAFFMGYE